MVIVGYLYFLVYVSDWVGWVTAQNGLWLELANFQYGSGWADPHTLSVFCYLIFFQIVSVLNKITVLYLIK